MDYYSEMYLYHNYVIGLISIIILLFFLYKYNNEKLHGVENYDEKVLKTTRESCGVLCTKTYDCSAFAFNNNICYLSKNPILGEPTNSPFMKDYNGNNFTCNKLQKITDSVIASDMDFKKNATYICTDKLSTNVQPSATNGQPSTANGQPPTNIFKIYDTEEKDLSNISELASTKINKYTLGEIDWGNQVTLTEKPTENITDKNTLTLFTEQNDEFLGQYMFPHRCVSNISQRDCLDQCLHNKKCLGTEWNPSYYKKINGKHKLYKNICCPKIQLKQNIPRRDDFKFGHFYLKEQVNKINDIDNNSVIVKM
jgi:hypothetical protein